MANDETLWTATAPVLFPIRVNPRLVTGDYGAAFRAAIAGQTVQKIVALLATRLFYANRDAQPAGCTA